MTATVRIRLAEVMKKHNISQIHLAEAAHMYRATLNKIYNQKIERIDFKTIADLVIGLKNLGVEVNVGDLLEVVDTPSSEIKGISDADIEAARQRALSLIRRNPNRKPIGLADPVPFRGPSSEDLLKADRGPAL
jgi:DNA-binding Xre family transcriptional regulator